MFNMADDSDVPPLEDMTDLMEKIQVIREQRGKKSTQTNPDPVKNVITNGNSEIKTNSKKDKIQNSVSQSVQIPAENVQSNISSKPPEAASKSSSGFGGMKKGFMFGGSSSKSKATQEKPKEESIPFIKKNEDALKLSEVQQAMSDTVNKTKDEWMTDDLLSQIEKNETLLKKLQDPRFMEAVNMFQTNPTAAMERYKNDKETQDAFMQFCGLMGNHFTNLADKGDNKEITVKPSPKIVEIDPSDNNKYTPNPPSGAQRGTIHPRPSMGGADLSVRSSSNPHQPTAEDEKKMQEILSRPEIMEVLTDPWVQNLFNVLRTNPESGQRLLSEADSEKKKMIKKLVDVGLLQFQT